MPMPDPRALANTDNLASYRAWQKEGLRRSGSIVFIVLTPFLVVLLTPALLALERAAKDGRDASVLMGAALAVYLAIVGGLSALAILRLNAWKRANPWTPPSPHAG
jgi:hypothetical protein